MGAGLDQLVQELKREKAELETLVKKQELEINELIRLRDHYQTITEFTQDWVYWLSPDRELLYVSDSCKEITGYSVDDFKADPRLLKKIIHPEDAAVFSTHLSNTGMEEEHPPLEMRVITANGEVRWVSHVCRPIYDRSGVFLGRRGSNRDITQRKMMEADLNASENRYLTMFDGIASCVAVYRPHQDGKDFIFVDFNRAAEKSSGMKREEVIGKRVTEVFPSVPELGLLDVFQRVAHTGQPENHPISHYRDKSLNLWVENYVYRLPSGEIVAIYSDLTKEKLAEEKLRIQGERLLLALEATSDGLWDWDIPSGRTYFSPRYFTMLGYKPDEMEHSFATWESLVHPDDLEPTKQLIFEHIERGKPFNVEFRLRNSAGNWQWVLSRGKIIERDPKGEPVRMVGTHVDIDERRRVNARLEKSVQELEALNKLSAAVSKNLSLDDVANTSLDQINQFLKLDLAVLYLIEDKNITLLEFRGNLSDSELHGLHVHNKWKCLCGLAARNNEPVFSADIQGDIRCSQHGCKSIGINSLASLPLSSGDKIIGVLCLGSIKKRDFSVQSSLLQSFAALISTGIANGLLHKEVVKYAESLERQVEARTTELVESENKFKIIFNDANDGILIGDAETKKLVMANKVICDMLGYSNDELVKLSVFDIHPEEYLSTVINTFEMQAKNEIRIAENLPVKRKDGSVFYADINSSPIEINGKIFLMGIFRDNTERKLANEALRASEDLLAQTQQIAKVGSWRLDLVRNQLGWSDEVYRIFGLKPREFPPTYEAFLEAVHPDDREAVKDAYSTSLQEGKGSYEIEHRIIQKDSGNIRYVIERCVHERDANGLVISSTGMIMDITERKQAQEHLEKSEKKYRHLIETLQEGVWSIDKEGYTTFVNPRMAELLGYSTEEMIGKHLFDFMDGKQVRIAQNNIERRKNGLNEQHDFEFIKKDGSKLYVTMETSAIVDEDGEYIGALAGVMDISPRKAVEEALQLERDNLHKVLHASPVGMMVFSEDEELLICNFAAERMFENAAGKSAGLRCGDFIKCIHRNDSDNGCGQTAWCPDCDLNKAIKSVLAGEPGPGLVEGEAKIIIEWSSEPLWLGYKTGSLNLEGKKCAILAVQDITDRKRAEDALRHSESRYRALFEKAAEGIFLHDFEGNFLQANEAALNMFGYTFEELKKLHPTDLVHPDDRENFKRNFEKAIENGFSAAEHKSIRKDGSEIIISARAKLVGNGLIQGVLLDVTREREQAKQINLLSRAIEHSAESVVITDKHGNIQYVNPAFTTLTGYSPEEALGKNPRIVKAGNLSPSFYEDLWRTITQGKVWQGQFHNISKSGKEFWEEATISPVLDDFSQITHFVATKNDITLRKQLEEHKEDVDRLMRHDLKSPLNAIIGFPDLIKEENNLTEEQIEFLNLIEISGRNMLKMIDMSLDLYRVEIGQLEYTPVSIDAVSAIKLLIKQNQLVISKKQLTIDLGVEQTQTFPDQRFIIQSEERLLITLLSNLFKNAIEASPEGETIHFYFNYDPKTIAIENKGIVPEIIRDRFFEKYVTHGKSSGTGLGTYSAKQLAKVMGYELQMYTSDEDNLTRININIPS